MTKKSAAKKPDPIDPDAALRVKAEPGETEGLQLAKVSINPAANAMATARLFGKGSFGELSVTGLYEAISDEVTLAKSGDLTRQRALLAAQAFALNSIFTEMSRRSALNMGEYIEASERYMRLALKAQSQCRATIEALDRLANGREQTVRHVHVDNRGGQAVIADTVHTGGQENGKSNGQPHALESQPLEGGDALRSANTEREAVPISANA